ncbi:MAG: acyl--CoA ligase [Clostridia bacterium]|nr:acyl--CoA ligase [Clostridia bacterium]
MKMLFETRNLFEKYTDKEQFDRIREYGSVTEMWDVCLSEFPDKVAISDDGAEYTFAKLEEDAAGFRTLLSSLPPHSRVGIYAPNGYDWIRAFVAVVTAGHVAAALPPQLDAPTVFGCSMMCGLSALVYSPALEEKLAVVKAKRPDLPLIPSDALSDGKTPAVKCEESDPCAIVFTGGTTGRSKGALLSHRAVMQGTVNGCYGYRDVFYQKYLLILPLTHVFGLVRNLMTSLYTGSTLFVCRNNKDMFRDIAVFRPTIMVMVPALAEMALTLSKKFGKNMLGDDLKTIICGAAPVSPFLIGEYDRLGIKLLAGYGLTESANLVSGNPESVAKPESVGIPFPHQEFRIAENGELLLRGKNMMDGYVGVDEPDAYDGDFFRTGDLVRMDDEGYLYITGRIKEIIVLPSGENVSPAEVEAYFNEFDFIQDSQVFEDENELGARILALEVVPRATELAGMEPEEKKKYIVSELEKKNATLPSHFRVSRITVRDADFERTPAMKIVRYRKFQ